MSTRARGGGGQANYATLESRQSKSFASSSIEIDLSLGDYVEVTLGANIDVISFKNAMSEPVLNLVTLEVHNPGFYRIDLSFAKWPGATTPVVTPNGIDIIELRSHKCWQPGTIYGRIWQNYV